MANKKQGTNTRRVVMVGTGYNTMGGISAVVNVYRASGLFERRGVTYLATHCDGDAARKLVTAAKAWLRFLALLCTGQVSLLHVHVSSRASFWRKLLFIAPAVWAQRPVLLHLHGSEFAVFYEQECSPFKQRLVRWAFNHATRVLVLSQAWADWTKSISTNPHIQVLFNPVIAGEPSHQNASKRNPRRVLFLGRMGQRKGTFDLLEAIAVARQRSTHIQLALGGDGDRAGVEAAISRLALEDSVELLGWVRGEAKAQQLAMASVFALPSYHEGLPMGILEAMAAGLAVVSTPVGGIPEAVNDGVEGFIVPPGDVQALANRLERLVAEEGYAARMGAAARRKVDQCFSAEVIVPQVEALYDELAELRP